MAVTELKERGIDPNRLNDRQRRFVFEYCKDYNAARAARTSGYKSPEVTGCQLLKHPLISAAIGKIQRLDIEYLELDRHEILQQLWYAVTRDPIDFCDPVTGQIVVDDMRKIPKHLRCCVDGVKVKQFTNPVTGEVTQQIELKLVPKLGALDLAMKHKGLFAAEEHNVNHTGTVGFDFSKLSKPPVVEDPVDKAFEALEQQGTIEQSPKEPPLVLEVQKNKDGTKSVRPKGSKRKPSKR